MVGKVGDGSRDLSFRVVEQLTSIFSPSVDCAKLLTPASYN